MWKPEPSLTDLQYAIVAAGLNREALLAAYRKMCLIRAFE